VPLASSAPEGLGDASKIIAESQQGIAGHGLPACLSEFEVGRCPVDWVDRR
jgi:hypothetical protein